MYLERRKADVCCQSRWLDRAAGRGKLTVEKVGGRPDEPVSAVEEFLLISTECQWYRQNRKTGRPVAVLEEAVRAGDTFTVDFVRVFDLVETDGKQHKE